VSTLHVTNGDSAAGTLRTILADRVTIMADVLHDGPAPRVDDETWYDIRARHISSGGAFDCDAVRAGLMSWDRAIVESRDEEIVLWFEHDLFDQLALIRTLDLLVRLKPNTTIAVKPDHAIPRVWLICIDRVPGVDRFIGLGQLTGDQLAALVDTRQAVTAEHYAVAARTWDAFRSDDPEALRAVAAQDSAPLTFLRPALLRFLEEYPSPVNGLSRTANAILRALETGPREAGALFVATQAEEPAPFMGDWPFFGIVRTLADARVPLVTIAPDDRPNDLRGRAIAITGAGRDVLHGRRSAIALNGIDTWLGGVHLAI